MQFRRFFLKKTGFLEIFSLLRNKTAHFGHKFASENENNGFRAPIGSLTPAVETEKERRLFRGRKFFEKMAHTYGGGRRLMRDTSKISLFFISPWRSRKEWFPDKADWHLQPDPTFVGMVLCRWNPPLMADFTLFTIGISSSTCALRDIWKMPSSTISPSPGVCPSFLFGMEDYSSLKYL